MSELLKVERLDVHYGGIQAVRDVSFTLHEGEQATLIGANGAGKSSTVRAIIASTPALAARSILADMVPGFCL
jgi:ABC-type branched-subunit amino acid transport system ATPase component